MMRCTVCGNTAFQDRTVLWDALASEWQLTQGERQTIDRQQGTNCTRCYSQLRSIVLADAIRADLGTTLLVCEFANDPAIAALDILEINEAGTLRAHLAKLPRHVTADYPAVDMHALPYLDASFDLVLHSDTLEHVPNPIHALTECRRVLRSGGSLCLTVPAVLGRLTRTRDGLPPSYHGDPATASADYMVQTEYGADAWTHLVQAGFTSVTIHTLDYPSAMALSARK
jgi:SAM-dependent methyltransferase